MNVIMFSINVIEYDLISFIYLYRYNRKETSRYSYCMNMNTGMITYSIHSFDHLVTFRSVQYFTLGKTGSKNHFLIGKTKLVLFIEINNYIF